MLMAPARPIAGGEHPPLHWSLLFFAAVVTQAGTEPLHPLHMPSLDMTQGRRMQVGHWLSGCLR